VIRLGSPVSEPHGVSLEVMGKGGKKRVSLRGWNRYDGILAHHWTIEEFAQALGLTVPPAKPRKPARSRI
jgi:hypothetical protein